MTAISAMSLVLSPTTLEDEVLDIYALARTDAFRAAISMLVFSALVALVLSLWLPKRKLVEAEPAAEAAGG